MTRPVNWLGGWHCAGDLEVASGPLKEQKPMMEACFGRGALLVLEAGRGAKDCAVFSNGKKY